MRVRPWWLVAASVVLLSAVLLLAEWVEVTEDSGFGPEARRNPYLAAERFLTRRGVDVERTEGLATLDALPPPSDTLLLASARRSLSEERVARLLNWTQAGGRLVVSADGVAVDETGTGGDRLLAALDVAVFEDQRTAADGISPRTDDGRRLANLLHGGVCTFPGGVTLLDLSGEHQPLLAGLHPSRFLAYLGQSPAEVHLSDIGPQMVVLPFGRGEVVVVTTMGLWRNDRIGCADHAHLLGWFGRDRGTLWWLSNTEMPALHVLLWQRFPLAIGLGAGMLMLWAWRQAFRVAGPVADAPPQRRQLMEHVEGVARFRFRQGDASALLSPMRAAVLGETVTDPGVFPTAALAARCGVPAPALERALYGTIEGNVHEFTEAVRILQLARRESGEHGAGNGAPRT